MSIITILYILFVHWIADFVLQTEWQATNKSKNFEALTDHTAVYTVVFWFAMLGYNWVIKGGSSSALGVLFFCIITFLCHTSTDYFTSRVNAKLWEEKKVHNFFVSIGFDQFLHFAQLLITFKLLL